jgi:hypothetical protein
MVPGRVGFRQRSDASCRTCRCGSGYFPVPKRLRYFLERDADLQGAALRLLLRAVESAARAQPWFGPRGPPRRGRLIHRFGSALNAHLHFHCVVIDGVFDAAAAGGVIFTAASGLEATAIAQVQAQVRRRLLRAFVRRGLLPGDDARAMAQWELVPPPRVHRHRYFGVLAPNAPCAPRSPRWLRPQRRPRRHQSHIRHPPPNRHRGAPLWDLPDAGTGGLDPNTQPAPEYAFDQRIAW